MTKISFGWLSYVTAVLAFSWWCYWTIHRPYQIIKRCHIVSEMRAKEVTSLASEQGLSHDQEVDDIIETQRRLRFDQCLHDYGLR